MNSDMDFQNVNIVVLAGTKNLRTRHDSSASPRRLHNQMGDR
jgi:hypothetical protein